MTTAGKILSLVPTLQAVALLEENIKESQKKKPKVIKQAVENIIGTEFIKLNADFIAGFP